MISYRRWYLVLCVIIALGLVGYAQYLFSQDPEDWLEPGVLYLGAILLFIYAWRASQNESTPEAASAESGAWSRLMQWAESSPIMFTVVAVLLGLFAARDAISEGYSQSYPLDILLWLGSVLSLVAAFISWDKLRWNRSIFDAWWQRLRAAWPEVAVISAIILLAIILRTFNLEHIPANLGGDEGEMGLEARAFFTGQSNNPFATGWLGHPSMFFLLQSLVMHVLGTSVTGLRGLSALLGILSVPACYLLVRQLHGRALALMTAALLAAFPYHIHYSRLGLNNIGDPFWAATVLVLTIQGINTRQKLYFIAAGLALGFAQYFYFGERLAILVVAVFLLYWVLQDRRKILSQWPNFLLMGLAGALILLPLLFFWARHPDTFLGRYGSMGIIPSGWLAHQVQQTGQNAATILLNRTVQSFLTFVSLPNVDAFYNSKAPLVDRISGIFLIFGLAYSIYRIREKRFFLFVSWFLLAMIFGGVLVIEEAASPRLLTTTIPLMFFVAVGLYQFAEILMRALGLAPRLRWALVGLAVSALVVIGIQFYFVDYSPQRAYAGDGGWMFTEMAHYLETQPVDSKVYFFGAPWAFVGHGTIRYIAPDVDGMDVLKPLTGPPDFVEPDRHAIFMFYPLRVSDLTYVQAAYPGGKLEDFKKPNGQELFSVYVVDDVNSPETPQK